MGERRVQRRARVSSIYATVGPSGAACLRAAGGDERLARMMLQEWQRWRAEYGEAWDAGAVDVPPPPHHDTAGRGYARPA